MQIANEYNSSKSKHWRLESNYNQYPSIIVYRYHKYGAFLAFLAFLEFLAF